MLQNIFNKWNDPTYAILSFVIWTIIVIILGIYIKIFPKHFFRIGLAKKDDPPVKFMGKEIKSNKHIILIMLYSFINELVLTYNKNIISPWKINVIQDSKNMDIDMSKFNLLWLLNLDNFFGWISYIFHLVMILTMEFQFIIPKMFASILIENISTIRYIADKQFIK
jgi:hypothetical protein